jgi:hypothetical protein
MGTMRMTAWQNFSLSGEFTFMSDTTASNGFRSTYYEDMASMKDRLRAWPRIDSFNQKGSFVTLFLPYQPLRDNLMLERLCPDADADADGDAGEEESRTDCLRTLWSVNINDQPVPMTTFETAERMDINMRGLIGLVPLKGLSPGLHKINVVWNPGAREEDDLVDDRYAANSRTFGIPVAFTPDYELPLN